MRGWLLKDFLCYFNKTTFQNIINYNNAYNICIFYLSVVSKFYLLGIFLLYIFVMAFYFYHFSKSS